VFISSTPATLPSVVFVHVAAPQSFPPPLGQPTSLMACLMLLFEPLSTTSFVCQKSQRHRLRQRPPAYSAVKVAGRRAYALARAGNEQKRT